MKTSKLYLNKQLYSECQLVTVINASIKLGGKGVVQKSLEYERLVDLVRARCGSAISIEKAVNYLGLKFIDVKPTLENLENCLEIGHAISVDVNTQRTGYHSVAIVDVRYNNKIGGHDFMVPNLRLNNRRSMWYHWKELNSCLVKMENLEPLRGFFRAFYPDQFGKAEHYQFNS